MRTARLLPSSAIALLVGALGGCVIDDLDPGGLPCPCPAGWVCAGDVCALPDPACVGDFAVRFPPPTTSRTIDPRPIAPDSNDIVTVRADGDDVRIVLGEAPFPHRLNVFGARDVVILGGLLRPAACGGNAFRYALRFHQVTGTIHVEGLAIELPSCGMSGIEVQIDEGAVRPVLVVQNVRIDGIPGAIPRTEMAPLVGSGVTENGAQTVAAAYFDRVDLRDLTGIGFRTRVNTPSRAAGLAWPNGGEWWLRHVLVDVDLALGRADARLFGLVEGASPTTMRPVVLDEDITVWLPIEYGDAGALVPMGSAGTPELDADVLDFPPADTTGRRYVEGQVRIVPDDSDADAPCPRVPDDVGTAYPEVGHGYIEASPPTTATTP